MKRLESLIDQLLEQPIDQQGQVIFRSEPVTHAPVDTSLLKRVEDEIKS